VISERIIPLEGSTSGGDSNNAEFNSSGDNAVSEIPPVDANDDLPF